MKPETTNFVVLVSGEFDLIASIRLFPLHMSSIGTKFCNTGFGRLKVPDKARTASWK